MIPPVHVSGMGVWAPGFPNARAWASGVPAPGATEPPAARLAAALRRRASALTRMVAEVAAQAVDQCGADLSGVPLVLGSALGEIVSATEIISSFREEGGLPSPTKFHNSVHNTAVGYLSIAAGNRRGATAVAAGPATAAMALLEAAMRLAEDGGAALLLLADEALPEPLRGWGAYQSGAVAFLLTAERTVHTRARLERLRRAPADSPNVPPEWREHPCAGGLALAAAIEAGSSGSLGLGSTGEDGWVVDVLVGTS